jgi:hypothetical protein
VQRGDWLANVVEHVARNDHIEPVCRKWEMLRPSLTKLDGWRKLATRNDQHLRYGVNAKQLRDGMNRPQLVKQSTSATSNIE